MAPIAARAALSPIAMISEILHILGGRCPSRGLQNLEQVLL